MKIPVVWICGFLAAAVSAAPVAQDIFLVSPGVGPQQGLGPLRLGPPQSGPIYNPSLPIVLTLEQLLSMILPAEHRVESMKTDPKPLVSNPGLATTSQDTPTLLQFTVAVPRIPEGSKLSISIDIKPSSDPVTTFSQVPQLSHAPTKIPTGDSVSVEAGNPDSEAGITVEAAPIVNILNFPETLANPQAAGEDELTNREPAAAPLAPGGIVQSSAPDQITAPFQNSKDSPFLIAMQEEAQAQFGTLKINQNNS